MSKHWSLHAVGAVPAGMFGKYMPRNRFDQILQSTHFRSNTDPRAKLDRAWKVKSVVDMLQTTFRRGYKMPPVLYFDQGICLRGAGTARLGNP